MHIKRSNNSSKKIHAHTRTLQELKQRRCRRRTQMKWRKPKNEVRQKKEATKMLTLTSPLAATLLIFFFFFIFCRGKFLVAICCSAEFLYKFFSCVFISFGFSIVRYNGETHARTLVNIYANCSISVYTNIYICLIHLIFSEFCVG